MTTEATSSRTLSGRYGHVHERYADDATFLWLLRSLAVNQPHYTAEDLVELDNRIDAQLDGLMTAPEESWKICVAALELQQPDAVFTAAILAFRSLDTRYVQQAVEAGLDSGHAMPGLVAAMAWLPGRLVHSWIKKFLTSKDLNHKYLALAVCSARREDPREFLTAILQREDCLAHPQLYARALRLIGELKRFDLLHALRIGMESEEKDVVFWSTWSAILLGDKSLAAHLQSYVLTPNPHQARAMALCFRVLPLEAARNWISLLAKDPANNRLVITATAILGDPHAINWLIAQMRIPALTRLAGEAFTTITGIGLQEHKLVLEELPDLDAQLPDDGAQNEDIGLGDDEYLPFPDVNKIAAVWQKYQQRYAPAQRYFMGQIISPGISTSEHLRRVFSSGHQRQRQMAAQELALLEPAHFLLNHAAKGLTK
ncbi:MAG: hypothetical protein K0Q78_161 [Cellvibrio sp.]|nr:hypothetical protein [Cellvibrio sp.]